MLLANISELDGLVLPHYSQRDDKLGSPKISLKGN